MSEDTDVAKSKPKYNSKHISGRTLRMPGLKPSDYFLFKQAREYFNYDMRQVVTLGLRLLYNMMQDHKIRESVIIPLASTIIVENLDIQEEEIIYKSFVDM